MQRIGSRDELEVLHDLSLRRVTREGAARLAALDAVTLDTPDWLLARWRHSYGEATARTIAAANSHEPALDLTVKSDAEDWAARLNGREIEALTRAAISTVGEGDHKHDVPHKDFRRSRAAAGCR